jgi:hypothetical protein
MGRASRQEGREDQQSGSYLREARAGAR